jgi:hypothetical protein
MGETTGVGVSQLVRNRGKVVDQAKILEGEELRRMD